MTNAAYGRFEGYFLKGEKHGQGTEYTTDSVAQANWVHGKKHGLAILTTGIGPKGTTCRQEW